MDGKLQDGGPAFPCGPNNGCGPSDGMSLRAYFAGQALAGIDHQQVDSIKAAKWSVEVADALLAELAKAGDA